ncbi:unnamed protein product [Heligmosomoides polygyrus]|uniref:Uncharacterized protein n=1 Tax=Heligmosomoides polygyrus TaxID=6339 RepID=A0A183FSP8_HELPZ|nr:unnamed protein product [Heligmosomoides polygyrus]
MKAPQLAWSSPYINRVGSCEALDAHQALRHAVTAVCVSMYGEERSLNAGPLANNAGSALGLRDQAIDEGDRRARRGKAVALTGKCPPGTFFENVKGAVLRIRDKT